MENFECIKCNLNNCPIRENDIMSIVEKYTLKQLEDILELHKQKYEITLEKCYVELIEVFGAAIILEGLINKNGDNINTTCK